VRGGGGGGAGVNPGLHPDRRKVRGMGGFVGVSELGQGVMYLISWGFRIWSEVLGRAVEGTSPGPGIAGHHGGARPRHAGGVVG